MNKHSVKCITSLQFTLVEKAKIKNVGHATSDVVISVIKNKRNLCEKTWPCYTC